MNAQKRITTTSDCFKTPGSTSEYYFILQQNPKYFYPEINSSVKFHSEGEPVVAYMLVMRTDWYRISLIEICNLKHLANFRLLCTSPVMLTDIVREDGFTSVRHCAFVVAERNAA